MCQSGVFRSLRPRLSEIKIILQNESVSVELLFSVDFPLSSRSLSVPYAYQCCAFWGCDSYAHSNPEGKSLQDHSVAEDKGKCVRFYGMNPSFCYRDRSTGKQNSIYVISLPCQFVKFVLYLKNVHQFGVLCFLH